MGRFDGRVALVTGAGAGIGEAVAMRLAAEGAAVAVLDVDGDAATGVALGCGGDAIGLAADVSDRLAVADAVERAAELGGGRIHIVINNAGIIRPAMFARMTTEQFDSVIDVHLKGTFHVCQEALAFLPDNGTGRIINSVSAAGLTGTIGQANYGAAKAALVGFTKSLAKELARQRITVNAVAPLAVTQLTETVRTDARFAEKTLDRIPMRRWAEPEEIAGAFAFLASDDASYITGQVLAVDGGMVM